MDLLEREGALGAVGEALDEASAGSGRVVLVAGEAGVGKSSLLAAVPRCTGTRGASSWAPAIPCSRRAPSARSTTSPARPGAGWRTRSATPAGERTWSRALLDEIGASALRAC